MRDRIISRSTPSAQRIYVSRALNPTWRPVEEREIEALFLQRDFVIIHPEEYDLADQIGMFAGASLPAGCSGSNIFNLAFQKNAKAFLILVSPLLVHYTEQLLQSAHIETPVTMIVGYVTEKELSRNPGKVHADWHLAPGALQSVLDEWIRSCTTLPQPAM